MPRDAREVMSALEKKGFVRRDAKHVFFHLLVDGRKTKIWTKVSHGEREISDNLFALMARQLLLSTKQLRQLVECPLSQAEYVTELRKGGHVS